MQLSKRLATVAECIFPHKLIADIGTDHAYLPVYLVQKGICPRAVAGDLNDGPVKSASETVRLYGMEDQIDVRQGNGLSILEPGEVDAVILAGMGGLLITHILGEGLEVIRKLQRLILQPNNNARAVRGWLLEKGWGITDEHLVEENGKFYPVIVAEPKRGSFTENIMNLEFGPRLLKKGGPVVHKYLEKKKREYHKILVGLSHINRPEAAEKKKETQQLLQGVEEEIKRGCNS